MRLKYLAPLILFLFNKCYADIGSLLGKEDSVRLITSEISSANYFPIGINGYSYTSFSIDTSLYSRDKILLLDSIISDIYLNILPNTRIIVFGDRFRDVIRTLKTRKDIKDIVYIDSNKIYTEYYSDIFKIKEMLDTDVYILYDMSNIASYDTVNSLKLLDRKNILKYIEVKSLEDIQRKQSKLNLDCFVVVPVLYGLTGELSNQRVPLFKVHKEIKKYIKNSYLTYLGVKCRDWMAICIFSRYVIMTDKIEKENVLYVKNIPISCMSSNIFNRILNNTFLKFKK